MAEIIPARLQRAIEGLGAKKDVPPGAPQQHERPRARHLDVVGVGHDGEDTHSQGT